MYLHDGTEKSWSEVDESASVQSLDYNVRTEEGPALLSFKGV